MMTPEQLKNSILQLAIEGKLVPQIASEGTGVELLAEIKNEKAKLVRDGKVYKKKATEPFYEDSYPIQLPSSWVWAQLSDVSLIQEGAGIRKFQYSENGIQLLCVTNILDGRVDLFKKQLYVAEEEYVSKYKHLTLVKGDIVTSCSGGSWGKLAIFNQDEIIMLNTSTLRLRFFGDLAYNKYLYYVAQSSFFKQQLTLQLSGMQPNFGYAHYSRICFPLPPLAEQKRIVAKLEELLPLVDEYAEAYNKLQTLNSKFPADLKKSLLQYAMEGKLVPQIASEGTGAELLEKIRTPQSQQVATAPLTGGKKSAKSKQKTSQLGEVANEVSRRGFPFAIPKTWALCRLGEIIEYNMGKTPPRVEVEWWNNDFPWVSIADMVENGHITYTKEKVSELALKECFANKISKAGTLIMSFKLTVGRVSILDIDAVHNEAIISIYPLYDKDNIFKKYLFYFLPLLTNLGDTKDAIKGRTLNSKSISALLIPLPPLAEQKRIVAKLEELLPLCEELK